jgi:hypothetical protein
MALHWRQAHERAVASILAAGIAQVSTNDLTVVMLSIIILVYMIAYPGSKASAPARVESVCGRPGTRPVWHRQW